MSKEKQIEEMAKEISAGLLKQGQNWRHVIVAEHLYKAGYRKQSEGEWVKDNTSQFEHRYNCSVCDYRFLGIPTPYCPNCGSKMKGGK